MSLVDILYPTLKEILIIIVFFGTVMFLVLEPLKELTTLLPDTARLTELEFSGEGIKLAGLADNAPELISKIEASKLFDKVTFRSPVMRRPESKKDRFEISLRFEGGPRP